MPPANRDIPRGPDGGLPACWLLAAPRRRRAHRLLAVQPARGHPAAHPGAPGQDPLAGGTRLPGAQDRPGPGPLRGPLLHRLASPRHVGLPGPGLLHPAAAGPKSGCAGLTLYAVLRELQLLLAVITRARPTLP